MKNQMVPMPMNNYQAQDDANTLSRAHEIMSDKTRHGAAKKHASKEAAKFQAIAGGVTGKDQEDKELVRAQKKHMRKGKY